MSRARMILFAGCLATVAGLAASAVQAESGIGSAAPGRIAGFVYIHNQPAENAEVYLVDRQGHMVDEARTDAQGTFRLNDVRPAKYTLYIESPIGRTRRDVEVRSGETVRLRIAI